MAHFKKRTKPLFIQVVTVPYYGSLGFREKEDCIALTSNAAQDAGYTSWIVSINQFKIKIAPDKKNNFTDKGVRIMHADGLGDFLRMMRRLKPDVVFGNDRTSAGFLTSLFGRVKFFMSHQSQNPPIFWQRLIFQFFVKRFDQVKVSNPYEVAQLRRLGVPKDRIHFIPIPIDYSFFSQRPPENFLQEMRKKFDIAPDHKVVLTVTAIRSQKKVYTVLEAAKTIVKKRPKTTFVFVGKDFLKDEGLPSVAEKTEELGISRHIRVTGRVTNEEVQGFMHLADVGVQSSSREGQCLTAYEKAAASLPLCLSTIGSFTSVFRGSARFHDPDDGKRLAKNILYYLDHPSTAKQHGEINSEKVRQGYDYQAIRKRMADLFRNARPD